MNCSFDVELGCEKFEQRLSLDKTFERASFSSEQKKRSKKADENKINDG